MATSSYAAACVGACPDTGDQSPPFQHTVRFSPDFYITFTETTTNTGKTLSFGTDTFSAAEAPAVGLGAYPGSVSYTQDAAGKVASITYNPSAGDIRIDNT